MIIKQSPEDFIVREYWPPDFGEGQYSVYLLIKRGWNTEDCLQWLSTKLRRPRKYFGYCGSKDKNALTEQYITIKHGPNSISTPEGLSLAYLGRRAESLHLGEHKRNSFMITVREYNGEKPALKPVKNYFGEQRFGSNNTEIGFALLTRNYSKAAELLKLEFTTDPIAALRRIPRHTLMLYVHSAQSKLWNELTETLPSEQVAVPLPGFAPEGTPELLLAMDSLLEKHGLSRESFINRSFQELSLEGGSRPMLQDIKDFSASVENGVCVLCFSLAKSQYATETVKQLVSAL